MPTPKLDQSLVDEALRLIAEYGSAAAAAEETGIPRQTLHRRAKAAGGLPTVVHFAVPEVPKLAKLEDRHSTVTHFVLPDVQAQPGVPLDHMRWAGQYAAAKRPNRIICIGDLYNMGSLSSYDRGTGKKSFEGQRYNLDIAAGGCALDLFMEPVYAEMELSRQRDERPWNPLRAVTLGNHCERVLRAINQQPELDGVIGYKDFAFERHGFKVYPFLDVAVLDGVAYSHYFTSGPMGRPITTARALLTKKHASCVMGHLQKYETAMDYSATGRRITALLAGCYYLHDEGYLDAQANIATWRGVHMLYGVRDGVFTHNSVDLTYLRDRFGK